MRLSLFLSAARRSVQSQVEPKHFPLVLYKQILRLHYGLPAPARLMGDSYVKDEFRRHRSADSQHVMVFLNEWTQYCVMLSKQLSSKGIRCGTIGQQMEPQLIERFTDEQLHQLLELKEEADRTRPATVSPGTEEKIL